MAVAPAPPAPARGLSDLTVPISVLAAHLILDRLTYQEAPGSGAEVESATSTANLGAPAVANARRSAGRVLGSARFAAACARSSSMTASGSKSSRSSRNSSGFTISIANGSTPEAGKSDVLNVTTAAASERTAAARTCRSFGWHSIASIRAAWPRTCESGNASCMAASRRSTESDATPARVRLPRNSSRMSPDQRATYKRRSASLRSVSRRCAGWSAQVSRTALNATRVDQRVGSGVAVSSYMSASWAISTMRSRAARDSADRRSLYAMRSSSRTRRWRRGRS